MSKFKDSVVKVVQMVPKGKVVSYGQVALYIGLPRAGRQVGWVLRSLERATRVPWWRVVNNEGRISIKYSRFNGLEQKKLLEKEGVRVNEDLTFDIEKYRLKPSAAFIKKLELEPIYLALISKKIPMLKPRFRRK